MSDTTPRESGPVTTSVLSADVQRMFDGRLSHLARGIRDLVGELRKELLAAAAAPGTVRDEVNVTCDKIDVAIVGVEDLIYLTPEERDRRIARAQEIGREMVSMMADLDRGRSKARRNAEDVALDRRQRHAEQEAEAIGEEIDRARRLSGG